MGRLPNRCRAGHRARRRGRELIRFRTKPYPVENALELERAAGLSRPVATIMARRGITSPIEAKAFLAADETHDPFEFDGMAEAVGQLLEAIRDGRKITVYGDFDCDGVCATAVLVAAIRELGGTCEWFIPDRISDGYGLSPDAISALAARGTSLIVTVDCGVTAVAEVAQARSLGMDVIVTDHHQPGPDLPDCPVLHPVVSGYPFPELCGTAVAAKLASALRREAGSPPERDEADLDLVALATVTDIMPLTGENRHLVREGIKVARRAGRVGMAALMAGSKIEATRLASEDLGFRLGPRINAAGRLYRADAGVELFLATSRERADEIATELASVNAERRHVEREVETEAKAALRELDQDGPAVVVAGEGWHPGVVGIVASKLVKATGRPSVVISLEGENGRGSARSVPGLDLHAALGDTAGLLETFGGHAAAAGLGIRRDRVDEFREALGRAVEERIGTEPAEPVIEYDAVAGGPHLGMDLAEELDCLQPFGKGNPAVRLLIPGARIENLREMGEGKHCRFSVCSGSSRASAVCFGQTSFGIEEGERADIVGELGVNHWNGSIEPQLRVTDVLPVIDAEPLPGCGADEWWARFEATLARPAVDTSAPNETGDPGSLELVAWPDGLPGVAVGALISSGERVAVLSADSRQRWKGLGGESLTRFIPDLPARDAGAPAACGIWAGSPVGAVESAEAAQVLVTDFASLGASHRAGPFAEREPFDGFDRIALLDPPYLGSSVEKIRESGLPVHVLAGADEFLFAGRVARHRLDLTGQLRGLFRGFREAGAIDGAAVTGETLREVLSADGGTTRSPEEAATLLRVLLEAGIARSEGEPAARSVGVVSSKGADLSASAVFAHHQSLFEDHERFLNHFNRQTQ